MGASTPQPLLSRVSRDLGVDLSILHRSVGRIKDTPYGQLVAVQGRPTPAPACLRCCGPKASCARSCTNEFGNIDWPLIGEATIDTR